MSDTNVAVVRPDRAEAAPSLEVSIWHQSPSNRRARPVPKRHRGNSSNGLAPKGVRYCMTSYRFPSGHFTVSCLSLPDHGGAVATRVTVGGRSVAYLPPGRGRLQRVDATKTCAAIHPEIGVPSLPVRYREPPSRLPMQVVSAS